MIIDINGARSIISFGMCGLQRCFSNSSFEMLHNELKKLTMKRNGYFTFQTIIGAHGAFSDAVCVGSPVIIIIYKKKLTNKYTEKFGFFN